MARGAGTFGEDWFIWIIWCKYVPFWRMPWAINYFLNATLNSVVSLGGNVTFGGPDPNGQKYSVTSGSRLSLSENVLPGTIPGTVDDKGEVF